MKKETRQILIISLAFMAINLAWSVYNSFVPVFLRNFTASTVLIGFIMTFDNIFGLFLQPYFGALSDKTRSRFGRRTPFLMVGIPIAAVGVILIPVGKKMGILQMDTPSIKYALVMMGAIIMMNIAMSIYRAPTVAMMPDVVPPNRRSQANGIVNLMGGLGSVIAFAVGGTLFDINESLPFYLAALLMVISLFALMAFNKEPENPCEADNDPSDAESLKGASENLFSWKKGVPLYKTNRNLFLMLLCVFFWFAAYNGVETFFTLFAIDKFNMTGGAAAKLLTFLSLSYLLSAVPAGFVGAKIGRKRTMLIGTVLAVSACLLVVMLGSEKLLPLLLILAGIGVGCININSFPSVVQMSGRGQTGKYTGFYYAFSFSANIASPLLFGIISDVFKTNSGLFGYALGMYIISFVLILLVDSKAVEAKTTIEAAEMKVEEELAIGN